MDEQQKIEYKGLQKIRTGDNGFKNLAIPCVSFANAQGGQIYIGYDNKKQKPLDGQIISIEEVNNAVTKLRSLCFNVSLSASEVLSDENGSHYFIITVAPSLKTIATTSDGKIYIRVADKCEPVRSEDIQNLSFEKGTYQWEIVRTKYTIGDIPDGNLSKFSSDIRASDKVKNHIREMDDVEIAEHYHLVDDGFLTHLGILWLGSSKQRSRLSYPITVQYLVFDAFENRIRKEEWHEYDKNPKELLLDIEQKAIELTYAYEFPDGLFRKTIRHYNREIVRELLVNSMAHKSYTISNDIMIKVYPDRLEISNPGGLPISVTKDNILHQRHRRNPHLIEVFSALKLMEGEGSGYDLIYKLNAIEAKREPIIESSYSEVTIIQSAKIINKEILPLLDFVLQNNELSSKNQLAFGLIARERKILATQLSLLLQLTDEDRLRSYIDRLLNEQLICKSGVKKGTQYFVNPQLIANAKINVKTTLKTIEKHALRALIIEDLKLYPNSLISEIGARLPDVEIRELRNLIYSMVNKDLFTTGAKTNRRYQLREI